MKKFIFVANIAAGLIDLYNGWYSLLILNIIGALLMLIDVPGDE